MIDPETKLKAVRRGAKYSIPTADLELLSEISARDAVHIAVMERHGIRSILSFDSDFDRWPGLQRIRRI